MEEVALFINGIYREVLDDIVKHQAEFPDYRLFLQPYKGSPIVLLRHNPPSLEAPRTLYASTTDDLAMVAYTAEIVGWENKLEMSASRRQEVIDVLEKYQPTEPGLYDYGTPGRPSMNLLHVRRMIRLITPFSVTSLIKTSDGYPLSPKRSRSGGWSPIRRS